MRAALTKMRRRWMVATKPRTSGRLAGAAGGQHDVLDAADGRPVGVEQGQPHDANA